MDGNEKVVKIGLGSQRADTNSSERNTQERVQFQENANARRSTHYSPAEAHKHSEKQRFSFGFQELKRPTVFAVNGESTDEPEPSKDEAEPLDDNNNAQEEINEEEGCDVEWMRTFTVMKTFLIIFGRWPLTYRQERNKKGYNFYFSWKSPGFIVFAITTLFTLYGFLASGFNVVSILMKEKVTTEARLNTEIIEQALLERHTLVVIITLGSFGINLWTSFIIFKKSEATAVMLTRWTHFLFRSKLSSGGFNTYAYVVPTFINFTIVSIIFVGLSIKNVTATAIGGPTVVSIVFIRHFLPDDYLDDFAGSTLHSLMHYIGLILCLYFSLVCNAFMYLFLWLIKSIENAFFCWNERLSGVIQMAYEDNKDQVKPTVDEMKKERTTFQFMYHDHIGLVRMLNWFNNMFAYSLEPYALFKTIEIVYALYLGALVLASNGKMLNSTYLGKYFVRKKDYIAAFLLMYQYCFVLAAILYACAWLEDVTYDSYEDLRKKALLKGTKTLEESFFYLSMFQSYTSTTKMSVYGGQFFCVDRYTVLHVLSAIMSNFLVVYQFKPLFDMDTTGDKTTREIIGVFLTKFEGLPANHTIPVSDAIRNKDVS